MKKMILLLSAFFFIIHSTYALLNLELTQGVAGAIPIAIAPFATTGNPSQNIAAVINNDLQNSGRFKTINPTALPNNPSDYRDVRFGFFRGLGVNNIVIGKVQAIGGGRYQVSFQLLDAFKGDQPANSVMLNQKFTVPENELRPLAHHISDLIYQKITGIRGVFSTRIAYVLVQRSAAAPTRYILEVSDQDGYNPKPLLTSTDPIMSPAWSPNGREIAYVSFEKGHSAIYIETVATGNRRLVSSFPGINGAPAWSPDGRKLALVLSKSGSPNIYVMDLATRQLTQYTHDFYINTEPSWSPDGRSLVFTSNRSSKYPQVYQLNLASGAVTRITYDGDYNARASFTRDGDHVVMLHRKSGLYNIAILNLNDGTLIELGDSSSDNESPSIAPNSSMVLFGTLNNGRRVLAMASIDGRVQVRLPAQEGDVQDPAWSPFLS